MLIQWLFAKRSLKELTPTIGMPDSYSFQSVN